MIPVRFLRNAALAAVAALVAAAASGQILAVLGTLGSAAESGGEFDADADFAARCNAAGVVACFGFNNTTEDIVQGVNLLPAGDAQYYGGLDTEVKTSGAGALRFDLEPPTRTTGANISGSWTLLGSNWGQTFSENDTFYVSYRVRVSDYMVGPNAWDGAIWKTSIFHYNNSTCNEIELTTSGYYGSALMQLDTSCGQRWFWTDLTGESWEDTPPLLMQQNEGLQCAYGDHEDPENGKCVHLEPNVWYELYYEIELGTWGQADSHVRMYVTPGGATSRTKVIDVPDMALNCNGEDCTQSPDKDEGYNNVTLTPYMTALENDAGPMSTAYMWFDEFIVSSSPIAIPGSAEEEPGPEDPGAPAYIDSMDVGFWYAMSGPSPGLGLSTTNVLEDTDPAFDTDLNPTGAQGVEPWTVGGAYISNQFSYGGWVAVQDVGPDNLGGLCILNAGHNTYLGNHVTCWWASTRTFERLNDPYVNVSADGDWQTTGVYDDGTPSLPHTIHYLTWHPTLKRIVVPGLEVNRSGSGEIRKIALFDPVTKQWDYTGSEGTRGYLGWAAYDSTRDRLIVEGSDSGPPEKFSTYDFDGEDGTEGSWAHYSVKLNGVYMAGAYSPTHDVIAVLHTDENMRVLDAGSVSSSFSTPTEAGSFPSSYDKAAFVWSPALDCFVAYNQGEDVYKICLTSGSPTTGTWTGTVITDAENEVTPPAGDANNDGVYSKFQLLRYGEKEMVCQLQTFEGAVYCMRIASNLEAVNDDRFARVA